ncbi:serine protease [Microcoleus sp. CAWBG640]|uniref:S1 family peptidase n=1 Tax=Microcoleus sp. CAWBG640 TaxID=2841653 RepID=UPI00312B81D5
MFSFKLMVGQLFAGIAIGVQAMPAMAELSPPEINSIARQTTVLIAPGLTPELRRDLEENRNNPLENRQVWNPGSGAIVAREGNKYYVLTVAHNFYQRYLDTPGFWQSSGGTPFYGIRTWDGEVHKIEGVNDGRGCPLRGIAEARSLIRFGCRDRFIPGTETVDRNSDGDAVKGIDLAIISFTSSKDYAVASIGDSSTVKIGDRVYISGWPDPEQAQAQAGQSVRPVSRRQRRLAWGSVGAKLSPDASNQGYSIFYTDCTSPGMSGGPVFDKDGRLVGNHGRGTPNKQSCGKEGSPNSFLQSSDRPDAPGQAANTNNLSERFSASQQVNQAIDLIQQSRLRLPFNLQMPSADLIRRGLAGQSVQATSGSSGRLEFDIAADRTSGAFDDPSDVIPDIYKEYSSFSGLGSRIKDDPGGGCGTILLGEPCP